MDHPTSKEPRPKGLLITFENILGAILGAIFLTGIVTLLKWLTEAFYQARTWIQDRYTGFLFACLIVLLMMILSAVITPHIKAIFTKKNQDDESYS